MIFISWSLLLSIIPGIEARGTSLYLLCSQNLSLIPFAVVLNFIGVFVFLKLLEKLLIPTRIENFLKRKTHGKIKKAEKLFEKYGDFAIFLLISIPSTGIGAYSGAFLGKVLGLKGWVFYLAIFLGILFSLLPLILVNLGFQIIKFNCP